MPRPSFGCLNCRVRRIKCDERQNTCLNCELYGNVCPGYPDRFDVLLRLRTPARSRPRQEISSSRPWTERHNDTIQREVNTCVSGFMQTSATRVAPLFMYDPDSVALALYYSKTCIDGSTRYSLEQIRAQGNGCLLAAINALSSIEIERKWSVAWRPKMLTESYHRAIRQLNLALAIPDEAKMDSTLIAVLIMSAIEMKAAPNATTAYWDAHTQGAAALLQIRGVEQVTSPLGSALFFQASSQLITSCILAKRSVPHELRQLRRAVRAYVVDKEHPSWRFHGVMLRLTDFLATTGDHNADHELARTTIVEASSICDQVASIFDNAGPEWQYRCLPSARYAGLLDYEHSYSTVLATQLWNGCRIALVLLCTTALRISDQCSDQLELSPSARSFLVNAVSTINQTALDIIAAIPQALAMIESRTASSNQAVPCTDICDRGSTHHKPVFYETDLSGRILPYVHGCMLQWSLYFAAQSEYIELRTRNCLLEMLDSAGRATQMKQWQILANKLRQEMENSNMQNCPFERLEVEKQPPCLVISPSV